MNIHLHKYRSRAGFTLVEAMTACSVFLLAIAGSMAFYTQVLFEAKAASTQSRYLDMARGAQQDIMECIHKGKAVSVVTNKILILEAQNEMASLEYVDTDNNPLTVVDNVIIYDPDTWVLGDERVVTTMLRPIDGQTTIFTNVPSSPWSVKIQFHLGDSTTTGDASKYGSGAGYQGVDLQFSAAPRNLQYWHR